MDGAYVIESEEVIQRGSQIYYVVRGGTNKFTRSMTREGIW